MFLGDKVVGVLSGLEESIEKLVLFLGFLFRNISLFDVEAELSCFEAGLEASRLDIRPN